MCPPGSFLCTSVPKKYAQVANIAPSNIIDPLLPVNFSENILTSNFGITYKAKRLTLGLSSTKLVSVNLSDDKYSLARHFYLNGSYDINLSENFSLKPQFLIRTDLIFSAIDINVLAFYKKKFWLGISARNTETLCFMGGIDIKEKYRIGYSNDITFSKLNNGKTGGTHEIFLGFLLK